MSSMKYSNVLLDHFYQPRNVGQLDVNNSNVCKFTSGEYHRGDVMELYLLTEKHKIINAKFKAYGSPATIAIGSWLTENIINKTMEQARQINSQTIIKALQLPEIKYSSAYMAEDLLNA